MSSLARFEADSDLPGLSIKAAKGVLRTRQPCCAEVKIKSSADSLVFRRNCSIITWKSRTRYFRLVTLIKIDFASSDSCKHIGRWRCPRCSVLTIICAAPREIVQRLEACDDLRLRNSNSTKQPLRFEVISELSTDFKH